MNSTNQEVLKALSLELANSGMGHDISGDRGSSDRSRNIATFLGLDGGQEGGGTVTCHGSGA